MRNTLIETSAPAWRICVVATALIVALLAAGCGGGGGGGGTGTGTGTSTPSGTATITGTLQGANGAPLSGYTVKFDMSSTIATTSNANGQFSLAVPLSAITGSDSVDIIEAGVVLDKVSVSVPATAGSTDAVGTLSIDTPPGPPSL